jgi:hypothetical protein
VTASNEQLSSTLRNIGRIVHALEQIVERHVPNGEDLSKELRQAKAIGQLTVLMGSHKLQELWKSTAPVNPAPPEASPEAPAPVELAEVPWVDYDSLSASEVVSALEGAGEELRSAVFRYESQQRARQSILTASEL